jgi:hypothetical protein
MSAHFPGWTWDPVRGEYYYLNNHEGMYVYQNGLRVAINQTPAIVGSDSRFALKYSINGLFLIDNVGKRISHYPIFLGRRYLVQKGAGLYKMPKGIVTPMTTDWPRI